MLIYMVLMMAGFNFLSHGSQDLYPTFLASSLHFSSSLVTITTVVSNCGAILGGMSVGYFSSFFGRRLSILTVLVVGACLIPAYLLPEDRRIMAGAFFQQMCVQGAWGVVPIHLMELSPVQCRSFVVGTAYQLGNLIASASSTIEANVGRYYPKTPPANYTTDKEYYDYGQVMSLFLAFIYVYLFIVVLLGPEKRNIDEIIDNDKPTISSVDNNNVICLEESSTSNCCTAMKTV
jgi:MFS transporter, SHS family, lactate transporter